MKYFNFLASRYTGCRHHCDLVAYFFRLCFASLGRQGTIGLISTNTISQGDTREGGLPVCQNGIIYSAKTRFSWPGLAAVVISIVHISKALEASAVLLNGRPVHRISAYLTPGEIDSSPHKLASTPFLRMAARSTDKDSCLPMMIQPARLAVRERILIERPDRDRIRPYLTGEEINNSPTQARRHVIYLSDIKSEDELNSMPELRDIIKEKVLPERLRLGSNQTISL